MRRLGAKSIIRIIDKLPLNYYVDINNCNDEGVKFIQFLLQHKCIERVEDKGNDVYRKIMSTGNMCFVVYGENGFL